MNPHQQNKVDINVVAEPRGAAPAAPLRQDAHQERPPSEQAQGKSKDPPTLLTQTNSNTPFLQERKYFDSGDYALSKAGKASDVGVTNIGSRHPVPENIPHLTSTSPGANTSGSNGSISSQGGQQLPGSVSGHPGSIGFQSRSPIKEGGSFLHRGSSASEGEPGSGLASGSAAQGEKELSVSPPPAREGVPIRR
ncbi:Endosulphine [Penicillium sp. DV-2018c]|nr:Endosulphine [Penicillium sp. DV-2018c]